jgi:predicted dehydrogenase
MSHQNESYPSRRTFLAAGAAIVAAGVGRSAGIDLAPPDRQAVGLKIPSPAPHQTGWAVVGIGQLTLEQGLPALCQAERCRPVALVSGHRDKALRVAEHYQIDPKNIYDYQNFDSIRDNPAIDVVYIVLPNSMHAEYTIRALEAGKHVLCEKPMAVSVNECQRMIDAAKAADRKLMIGYRLRYEPHNQKMIEISRAKKFGPIRAIEAANFQQVQAPNIRLSKELAGGPLSDVGIYCVNATRYITGENPVEVSAMQFRPGDDPRFAEVPDRMVFQMRFPSGVLASCSCGFSSGVGRRYRVFYDKSWAEMDPAFGYDGLRMRTSDFSDDQMTLSKEELVMPEVDHFAYEMDHLAQCIAENKEPLTPGEEGLADIRVLTAIQQSADTGRPVQIT